MARVEEQTGIPLGTLNYWKTLPWWFEQMERIRQEQDIEVDNQFSRIVKKTQEVIMDRLENGDIVLDKYGSPVRKPIGARDAAIINAIAIDKRKVLRDTPNANLGKVGMQERLKNLEAQFTKLVKTKQVSVIDLEVIQNDNQENEGRLQSSLGEIGEELGGSEDPSGGEETLSPSGVLQEQEEING